MACFDITFEKYFGLQQQVLFVKPLAILVEMGMLQLGFV